VGQDNFNWSGLVCVCVCVCVCVDTVNGVFVYRAQKVKSLSYVMREAGRIFSAQC
jgi:hypothetical protein